MPVQVRDTFVLVFMVLCACQSPVPTAPERSSSTQADILELEKEFGAANWIRSFYSGAGDKATRNKLVTGRMALVDLHYQVFLRRLVDGHASVGAALDLSKLAVDQVGTVIAGEQMKTILLAVSGGLTGTQATLQSRFFYQQTIHALVASMNAVREAESTKILIGLDKEVHEYSFAAARVALERYYNAGTIMGALQEIQSVSAKTVVEKKAEYEKAHAEHIRKSDRAGGRVVYSDDTETSRAASARAADTKAKAELKRLAAELTAREAVEILQAEDRFKFEERVPDEEARTFLIGYIDQLIRDRDMETIVSWLSYLSARRR